METSSLLFLLDADILQSKRAWNETNFTALLHQPPYPPVIIVFLEHRKVSGLASYPELPIILSAILNSVPADKTGLELKSEQRTVWVNFSEGNCLRTAPKHPAVIYPLISQLWGWGWWRCKEHELFLMNRFKPGWRGLWTTRTSGRHPWPWQEDGTEWALRTLLTQTTLWCHDSQSRAIWGLTIWFWFQTCGLNMGTFLLLARRGVLNDTSRQEISIRVMLRITEQHNW